MKILKIGYAEFETPDVYKLSSYYSEVIGLNITYQDADAVYLASTVFFVILAVWAANSLSAVHRFPTP